MLKNLDPLLSPELLYVLAAMGHGDEVAVVDANFPADSVARRTGYGRLVTVAGASMPEVVRAILSVLPLDEFVDQPVRRMAVDGAPDELPAVQREVQAVVDTAAGRSWPMGASSASPFTRRPGVLMPSCSPENGAISPTCSSKRGLFRRIRPAPI